MIKVGSYISMIKYGSVIKNDSLIEINEGDIGQVVKVYKHSILVRFNDDKIGLASTFTFYVEDITDEIRMDKIDIILS